MLILMINQWRIQKTSEGMAVFQKGVAVIVKKYISTSIRGKKTFFFHFYCEKMRKKFCKGVAVAGSPNSWTRQCF